MSQSDIPDFRQNIQDSSGDLESLRQNWLLSESSFISFARERGVPVSGVISGDPSELHKHGLLTDDGTDADGAPRFHPFRMYSLYQTLKTINLSGCASLIRDVLVKHEEKAVGESTTLEKIEQTARRSNSIVDLAILLEPIYSPPICG